MRYSTSRGTTTEPPSGAPTISGITGTSTAVTELAQGTTYYIWVKAVASVGDGPYSTRTQTRTIRSKILNHLYTLICCVYKYLINVYNFNTYMDVIYSTIYYCKSNVQNRLQITGVYT